LIVQATCRLHNGRPLRKHPARSPGASLPSKGRPLTVQALTFDSADLPIAYPESLGNPMAGLQDAHFAVLRTYQSKKDLPTTGFRKKLILRPLLHAMLLKSPRHYRLSTAPPSEFAKPPFDAESTGNSLPADFG